MNIDETTSRFVAIQLTTDHTCEVDREHRRILEYGGRVDRIKYSGGTLFNYQFNTFLGVQDTGPLRVWFRYEEKPGLAMTRTIGDHNTRSIGVLGKPEICKEHTIEYLDYAIVLGSDGLFEYLSNQRIADIIWRERMKTSQEI